MDVLRFYIENCFTCSCSTHFSTRSVRQVITFFLTHSRGSLSFSSRILRNLKYCSLRECSKYAFSREIEGLVGVFLVDSSKDFRAVGGRRTSMKRFFSARREERESFLLDLRHLKRNYG